MDDAHHHECVELFTGLHLAGRALLVPGTVIAEVGYLLARNAGPRVEALFLNAVADGDFQLVDLLAADVRRAADLVRTYGDLPLGTTDATVMAVADPQTLRRAGPACEAAASGLLGASQPPVHSGGRCGHPEQQDRDFVEW